VTASLIRGGWLLTDAATTHVMPDAALVQRDGVITEVGPYGELRARHPDLVELGSPGHLVMPGLVNAHHHGGLSSVMLGCVDGPLELWLSETWARRDADPYLDTLYGCARLLRAGVTTVMHNLVRWIPPGEGVLDRVADEILRAYRDAGMRVAFSVAMREERRIVYEDDERFLAALPASLADALRERLAGGLDGAAYVALCEDLIGRHGKHPRTRILLSPANVHWVSDRWLERIKESAGRHRAGIHMHLAETAYQRTMAERAWRTTPVGHLRDLGFLGPELSCAHAVWLSHADLDVLAAHRVTVCHNPSSNLRLSSGIAPVATMLERGVPVALGVDSAALGDDHDMLQEIRLAAALQSRPGLDTWRLDAGAVLTMATIAGARATGFGDEVGTLSPGRRADVVLIDVEAVADPCRPDPAVPVLELVLRRATPAHVSAVVVDGETVYADGRATRFDEPAVRAELRRAFARPLSAGEAERRAIAQALRPWIRASYTGWPRP
jgi:cytosine/adenosine deaminase-related metal-dependent hydrolase